MVIGNGVSGVGCGEIQNSLIQNSNKFGKVAIAVPPHYTSQNCSQCGQNVKKSLSVRTHVCKCGAFLDRDENASIVLNPQLSRFGYNTKLSNFKIPSSLNQRAI